MKHILNTAPHANRSFDGRLLQASTLRPAKSLQRVSTAFMAMALMSGSSVLGVNAFADDMPTPEQTTTTANPQSTARGVLRAGESADIAAGMAGRLLSAPLKSGQYFKRGALLAKFDCKAQEAELEARKRAYETLSLKHDNVSELTSAGAAGTLDLGIARSEMHQAASERDAIKARLKDCTIYAPYAGYISEKHVSTYETPQIGQPLYSVIRAGKLEISIIAPSQWMRWVKTGSRFDFTVDETGEEFKGKIVRMGASVDPVSQTIELTAVPTTKTGKALAGMSGVALFEGTPES